MEDSFTIFDSAIRHVLSKYGNMTEDLYNDLYQECYLSILDVLKNHTYDPVMNLYGYAYSISRNAVTKFMYHHNKMITLSSEEFPEIPTETDFDNNDTFNYLIDKVFKQFSNILPDGYTKQKLIDLVINQHEKESLSRLEQVMKGEFSWSLESYLNQRN